MIHYKDAQQVLEDNMVIESEEILFKNNLYKKERVNSEVERGEIKNLECITFRNEEERHDINVYHLDEQIMFVETGYGS